MISKTGMHAITALTFLAELPKGAYLGASDLAAEIGAPPNYLGKLLRSCAETGLVESQKGKGGGFRLRRDPAAISMYDVIEPIDHVSRWNGCFLRRGRCTERAPCAVHDRWGKIREQYLQFLLKTTIAELAGKG
jgi:Rrf2 family transcriptional regulator, iron-sulfur cluster assembly transcription factor